MEKYNKIKTKRRSQTSSKYVTSNFRKRKFIDRNRIINENFLLVNTNKFISLLNDHKLSIRYQNKFKKKKFNQIKTSYRVYYLNLISNFKPLIKNKEILFNKRHYTHSSLKIHHKNTRNYVLFKQKDFLNLIDYEQNLKKALKNSQNNAVIESLQRKHIFRNFLELESKFDHLRLMLDDANRDNLDLSNELKTAKELLFKESKRLESTLKEYNQIMNERDVVHKEMEAMTEKLNKYEDMNKSFTQHQQQLKTSQNKINTRNSSMQKNIDLIEEFDKFIETSCEIKLNGFSNAEPKSSNSDLCQNEKMKNFQLNKNKIENQNGLYSLFISCYFKFGLMNVFLRYYK